MPLENASASAYDKTPEDQGDDYLGIRAGKLSLGLPQRKRLFRRLLFQGGYRCGEGGLYESIAQMISLIESQNKSICRIFEIGRRFWLAVGDLQIN